jgi:1-acyl-sn-glycerol-3-phosphate acyltransferase
MLLAALLSVLLAPLWIPAVIAADLLPGRRAAARCAAAVTFILQCEAIGILASAGIWLLSGPWLRGDRQRYLAWNSALQVAWARSLFAGARRIYGIELEVEGLEEAREAPFLLFPRHTSLVDTVLPVELLGPSGMRFRYVLKRELLWDPCLDIVGQRLPNCFVERDSEQSAQEIARVAELARGLSAAEVLVLYPEGTRFTEARRDQRIERLRARGSSPLLELTQGLRRVLPPRPGGPLACLAAAPGVDCVFLAHTGLEGAARFRDLWRGDLVGQKLQVRLWRVRRAQIPDGDEARTAWLNREWARLDAWVVEHEQRGWTG